MPQTLIYEDDSIIVYTGSKTSISQRKARYFNVRLSQDMYDMLSDYARRGGVSRGAVVRAALKLFFMECGSGGTEKCRRLLKESIMVE